MKGKEHIIRQVEEEAVADAPYLRAERGEDGMRGRERKRNVGIRGAPKGPTKRQREEHEALHERYEGWCRHWLRGRGSNKPHRRIKWDEELEVKRVPRVSLDYNFAGEGDEDVGAVDDGGLEKWGSVVEDCGIEGSERGDR